MCQLLGTPNDETWPYWSQLDFTRKWKIGNFKPGELRNRSPHPPLLACRSMSFFLYCFAELPFVNTHPHSPQPQTQMTHGTDDPREWGGRVRPFPPTPVWVGGFRPPWSIRPLPPPTRGTRGGGEV